MDYKIGYFGNDAVLRETGTLGSLPFCMRDFLFAFQCMKLLLKMGLLEQEIIQMIRKSFFDLAES